MKNIIGTKIGMTQIFEDDGASTPVTVVDVNDVVVSSLIQQEDKITHVELGLGKKKKPTKAEQGMYKEIGYVPRLKFTFKLNQPAEAKAGDQLAANVFEVGEKVDVTATTKGKGFQGVMKRHGFKGGPKTHGGPTGKKRSGGSIGASATPSRVIKGMKMPGQMGNVKQTTQGLKVAFVDVENNLIGIKGALPGANGSLMIIKEAIKK